jgi:hypothetical protein
MKNYGKINRLVILLFYLKTLLIVSDNNAFNPIYDFVTPIGFMKRFEELGFKDASFQSVLLSVT